MTRTGRERRDARLARLVEQARRAYADHEIVADGPRCWHIARRGADGRLDSCYSVDVYAGHHGQLYVGGDIDCVVFAAYGDNADPVRRLRWMGRCQDLDYYVAQKAAIGMTDDRKMVWDFDGDTAAADIREHVAVLREGGCELDEDELEQWEDFAAEAAGGEISPDALYHAMYHALPFEHLEGLDRIGSVLSGRVVYAWAALARLCDLLDERADKPAAEC
jgi:hypothetical protein